MAMKQGAKRLALQTKKMTQGARRFGA